MLAAFDLRDPNVINVAYLVAAICFIVGLRRLSTPSTARSGNYLSAAGMALALVATLLDKQITSYGLIIGGVAVGTLIGVVSARSVKMTAMPQMVALFNGVGGGAVALVAASEFHHAAPLAEQLPVEVAIAIPLSAMIGSISFSGSMIAFAKLQELMSGRPITFPLQKAINILFLLGGVVLVVATAVMSGQSDPSFNQPLLFGLVALALVIGVSMVIPIGGADMPVVISLLNSFTGLSAALAGFELSNNALIIGGTLVGASGTLLTVMMGRAMNRTIANVIFGAFGGGGGSAGAGSTIAADTPVRETNAQDAAIMLSYADRVVIVPGYGLAVAQAQHNVRELADALEEKGVDVKYAIHPVAGRMPGHMNVLLAEADVPYDQLYDMEDINPEFSRTDVALIVGANDVTNPAARDNESSPIYGMPILEVDQAENIVVLKRSMSPGFAGIDNELYYNPKTQMLFGDAKDSVVNLVREAQQV